MLQSMREAVFGFRAARWAVALFLTCRAAVYFARGRQYRALNDLCWIVRVSTVGPLRRRAERLVLDVVRTIRRDGRNTIVESYRRDRAASACASLYTVAGGGPHDLFRDLIVLKPSTSLEKGVILLKYARTFDAVVAMFDLARLMERYTFVLEPCWAGYWDPSILMYFTPGHAVFVQCFTADDHRVIAELGAPFVPLRMGPADWVDADLFKPPQGGRKPYDLVMVANWAPHKRHATLFRALEQITDRDLRVLLIGFPLAGWTVERITREAAAIRNARVTVDVVESLPASEVAAQVGRCKVFVFLSRKEGDNKALVEAMFADVPAIVYEHTIGGAGSRINPATGIFASDEELATKIVYMLDHHGEFEPRRWALEHTGSANATRLLDETIRRTLTAAGQRWTHDIVQKTNSPNLAYKDLGARARFQADYERILACRLESGALAQDAVA